MSWENLSRDLHSILNSYLDLIGCDGGSIYTLQKNLQGDSVLTFKAMVTRSAGIRTVPDSLKSVVFRLDDSTLVGKTGLHQKVFKESYVDLAPTDDSGTGSRHSFIDVVINYQTKNILCRIFSLMP